MRLFIAIRLTPHMRESLEKAQEALRESGVRGRYVPSENLHLTLAFLGEVKDPAPVISALSSLSFRPFMIGTGACIGHFGDLLWAGLEEASGSGALSRLVQEVRSRLDGAGIAYDRKDFVPHITLVRHASGSGAGVQVEGARMRIAPRGASIALLRSDETNGRRVYTPLRLL